MKLPDSFDSLQEILNPGLPDLVPLSVAKQELSRLSQLLPALLEASGLKTIQTSEPDFLDIGILDNSPTPNVFITLRAEIAFKKIKPHQGAVIQTLKQGNLQPRDCAINTMACL